MKAFLERQGFVVKGEVGGCDAVGVRADPPCVIIIELKRGLTLELVLQGVDRLRAADAVWLAVPATTRGRDRDRRAHRLCRLLGFGLLAVRRSGGVEVLTEPAPYRPRPDLRRRAGLLREHGRRIGDPTPGGQTRQPIMTAYRQQALVCAHALRDGAQPVRALSTAVPEASRILLRNVYGWFAREARGIYGLSAAGRAAISLPLPDSAAAAQID